MKIIFVYNAKSGIINAILDSGHKVISPGTYQCNLCKLTYGLVSEKKEWKEFRRHSTDELEFLHIDEFEQTYGVKKEYPVVLYIDSSNELAELIGKEELNRLNDVGELIQTLKTVAASA